MLGLLVVFALIGLVMIAGRRRPQRWFGAGLLVLSLLTLGWIVALIRADGPPDPLPEVHRAITTPIIA